MNRFKKLVEIHATFLDCTAGRSVIEYGVLIHIGLSEYLNEPLTLKQLMLLNLGPKSTVERIVKDLVQSGKVLKTVSPTDRRSSQLLLSAEIKESLNKLHAEIESIVVSNS